MIEINNAADYLLYVAHESGDPLTPLKLQKLAYYAQAWHLALHDSPLVPDAFEAWIHGPVAPALYRRFCVYKWNPIPEEVSKPSLPGPTSLFLDEVIEAYMGLSAWELERLTHAEAPWKNARGTLAPDEASNAVISHEDMKAYYRAQLSERTRS